MRNSVISELHTTGQYRQKREQQKQPKPQQSIEIIDKFQWNSPFAASTFAPKYQNKKEDVNESSACVFVCANKQVKWDKIGVHRKWKLEKASSGESSNGQQPWQQSYVILFETKKKLAKIKRIPLYIVVTFTFI